MIKQFLRDYFTFNRRERNGILILLLVIFLQIAFMLLYPLFRTEEKIDFSGFEKEVAVWKTALNDSTVEDYIFDTSDFPGRKKYTRHYADNKFKRFSGERDSAWRQRFAHFNAREDAEEKYERKKRTVELNSADSLQLVKIPGIGPWYAHYLITYRDKLGGFLHKDQVGEIINFKSPLADSVLSLLTVDTSLVSKKDINAISVEDLKKHPYFRWNLANAIVQYRNMHGNFRELSDVRKIDLVNDSVFAKIAPYLTIIHAAE
ncbi:MAG: helix-hairpin-helix domain-containing protein [Bacteroidetes bacterium]|nr:helix-hairpin-helix domain-containing protein [Bacteroidota bacterium]